MCRFFVNLKVKLHKWTMRKQYETQEECCKCGELSCVCERLFHYCFNKKIRWKSEIFLLYYSSSWETQNSDHKNELFSNKKKPSSISVVFKNFSKFAGKVPCQSLFFNKIAGFRPATSLKKRIWDRCFPENFAKFLRTLFLQNTSKRLLLNLKQLLQIENQLNCKCHWNVAILYWFIFVILTSLI